MKVHKWRDLHDAYVVRLTNSIAAYEERYGMTTDELRQKLDNGCQETVDFCNWLFLAGIRDRIVERDKSRK